MSCERSIPGSFLAALSTHITINGPTRPTRAIKTIPVHSLINGIANNNAYPMSITINVERNIFENRSFTYLSCIISLEFLA